MSRSNVMPQSAGAELVSPQLRNDSCLSDFDLGGKIFVVTGGAQGLGLTLAEALVEAGGRVYCLDRSVPEETEFVTIASRLELKFPKMIHYVQVDVQDSLRLDAVIAQVAQEFERLDGLVAAAGIQYLCPALDYPPEEIMRMMNINYQGVYMSATSCARQMIKYKCRGSIVLIASMSGFVANKGLLSSVYNSSKAAVIQLSRNLAMEWGKVIDGDPIRVNALCPGNIITPMVEANFVEVPELKELWERENMMGRLSLPREYRGAVIFLLSQASSFMTGSQLVIDGGYSAW